MSGAGAHGWRWTGDERPDFADEPGPGEESVWDYPRPPRVEEVGKPVRVEHAGAVIASTERARRVVETAGAPVYYVPPEDVDERYLRPGSGGSHCEWKGRAVYHDVVVGERRIRRAAWSYPEPGEGFGEIGGWYAFYASKLDACFVDDERVRPQPGGFYGGWVTPDLVGPIKGEPGSGHW